MRTSDSGPFTVEDLAALSTAASFALDNQKRLLRWVARVNRAAGRPPKDNTWKRGLIAGMENARAAADVVVAAALNPRAPE